MRIVIDMQGAQTESRFRGVGHYTMSFAQAIVRNKGEHEVFLALSGLFPETIQPIRDAFADLLPRENIQTWYVPNKAKQGSSECRKLYELIREAFLSSLNPDVIHLTYNVFEKTTAETVFSAGLFDTATPVTTLVYQHDSFSKLSLQHKQSLKAISAYMLSPFRLEKCSEANDLNLDEVVSNKATIDTLLSLGMEHKIFNLEGADKNHDLDQYAMLVIRTWISVVRKNTQFINISKAKGSAKLRLANISPLPRERSGIADYSAELLPYLSKFYEIDVVADQEHVNCEWIKENCNILTIEEFSQVAEGYDRILYHFGNNPMHVKMFELLKRFPGIVVLHDFFLSGVQWYREAHGFINNSLWNQLYLAHGYKALQERSIEHDESVVFRYPCNFTVLQDALGVIVHSENSLRLAKQWYSMEEGLHVIPLLRHQAEPINRKQARKELGFSEDDFVVCSFGFVGKTKLNDRLLDVWEESSILHADKRCKLVFVGDSDDSPYTHNLTERMRKHSNVEISGWTDTSVYRSYLAAADVAVQLRTLSRGETSAAVLDCMNYAIATVINANGSMADIPDDVALKIPDEFHNSELRAALELLRKQPKERQELAYRAQQYIHTSHAPSYCAEQYEYSIENFYQKSKSSLSRLISSIAQVLPNGLDEEQLNRFASVLAQNFPNKSPSRTLFVDVSVVAREDFKTGIQRVVRAITLALIKAPPEGFRIEPVYLSEDHGGWHYRYARDYTLGLLNLEKGWMCNERIEEQAGDILLGLDLAGGYVVNADREGVYRDLKSRGVLVSFVVYDLIPIQFDDIYPPGFKEGHADWLKVVASNDSAICISKAVADDLREWVEENATERVSTLNIQWFHLGADLDTSLPSTGIPEGAKKVLQRLSKSPSFLVVATVEPRKGHGQVLDAFDELWSKEYDFNLVIVGKEGWMVDELATRLRRHSELGKRLHWLEGISDEYLEKAYAESTCLIAASYGEGFGLPLIEAAQKNLPILARDIPVFREVAGENASYFTANEPSELAQAIENWLTLYKDDKHPKSNNMPWLTWKESAANLLRVLGINA